MKRPLIVLIVSLLLCSTAFGEGLYRDGELIVKFKPGALGASAVLQKSSTSKKLGETGAELVGIPQDVTVEDAVEIFSSDPSVLYAEPNYILRKSAIPNDTNVGLQWGLFTIDAPLAWDITKGSRSVTIAIIDTGTDFNHPDLQANIWLNPGEAANGIDDDGNGYVDDLVGWDFVSNDNSPLDDDIDGHGTHVAGIAGAVGNNGIGVSGVNWSVSLMPLKILNSAGSGSVADEIEAIAYAADNGARIINASYTFPSTCILVSPSIAERDAIEDAMNKGVLFVTVAGNGGCNTDVTPFYPAGYDLPNIVAVGAASTNDTLHPVSNYGHDTMDLAAPGISILSTLPSASYGYLSGTSMASPHVAGLAALVLAARPGLTYQMLKETLISTSDKTPAYTGLSLSDGRINAHSAVAAGWPLALPPVRPSGLVASLNGQDRAQLNFEDNSQLESGFELARSIDGGAYQTIKTLGSNITSYSDTGLSDGRRYEYIARAFNSYGSSSYSASSTVVTPMNAPSGLEARSISATSIDINWNDNSSTESGFRVERAIEGGSFVLLAQVGAGATSMTDTGLTDGITYVYRVQAFNGFTSSAYSNQASATAGDGSSGGGGGGGGGCFIATAAWGDYDHPVVKIYRRFRDEYLMGNPVGEAFIKLYYRNSPPIARVIAGSPFLRVWTMAALIPPAAGIALFMYAGPVTGAIIILIMALILGLMFHVARRGSAGRLRH